MGLKGKGAFSDFAFEFLAGLRTRGFSVGENDFAIHFHSDGVALDDDVLGPPFTILRKRRGMVRSAAVRK